MAAVRLRPLGVGAGAADRLGQRVLAPACAHRVGVHRGALAPGVEFDRLYRGMAAPVERDQQPALTQRDDAQDGVVHGEFAVAAQLGGEALAVMAEGLPQAAGDGAERGGGAQGEAAGHQVDADPRGRARGRAGAEAHAHLAQGLGVEEVVVPAPVGERQVGHARVVGAEAVQAQQRVHAGLLAAAHVRAQALDRDLQRGVVIL